MVSQSSQPAKSKEQPKQPQPRRFALLMTHFCASMGYLFCLLLWVWCAMQLLYPYITRDKALWVIPEPHDQPEITLPQGIPSGADLPQPIAIALVAIITIVMIGCGLYMLVMLPRNIAKTGERVVKKTTKAVAPLATKSHQPVSKKQRIILNARIAAGIKALACVVPVIVLMIWPGAAPLSQHVVRIVAVFCAGMASLSFLLQYALARILGVPDTLLK